MQEEELGPHGQSVWGGPRAGRTLQFSLARPGTIKVLRSKVPPSVSRYNAPRHLGNNREMAPTLGFLFQKPDF